MAPFMNLDSLIEILAWCSRVWPLRSSQSCRNAARGRQELLKRKSDLAFRSALRRLQHQPGDAPDTPAADENPARLSIRFVSLARTAPWQEPGGLEDSLQRSCKERITTTNCMQFHCCTPSFSTDADLIAESICLVSASEVRRERSVLAIKACNEGSKPQDIPSDHKTRQGASAEARYDTSNAGVLAR